MTLLAGLRGSARPLRRPGGRAGRLAHRRPRPAEIEGLIGCFVNTLVLRTDLAGDPTFRELLRAGARGEPRRLRPPGRAVREAGRGAGARARPGPRAALPGRCFALQNAPRARSAPARPRGRGRAGRRGAAKFDLGVEFDAGARRRPSRLGSSTTATSSTRHRRRLLGHFHGLLRGIAARPGRRACRELPLLGDGRGAPGARRVERRRAAAAPRSRVHSCSSAGGARPGRLAVVCGDGQLTYGELDGAPPAGAPAARARRRAGEVVGVCLERSLRDGGRCSACSKAGGAYLPLDPALPAERLAFLLADSGAPLVLTDGSRAAGRRSPRLRRLPAIGRSREAPDLGDEVRDRDAWRAGCRGCRSPPGRGDSASRCRGRAPPPTSPTYLHLGLDGHAQGRARRAPATWRRAGSQPAGLRLGATDDRMPCLASFSFDISLFELLDPLLAGGSAVIVPLSAGARPRRPCCGLLAGSTRLHAVPALMRQVVEPVRTPARSIAYPGLRTLFVGGDAVSAELLADLRRVFPRAELVKLYGPTEATIICSRWRGRRPARCPADRRIGRPLPGARLHVVDRGAASRGRCRSACPASCYIGGAGVARGYLGRPRADGRALRPDPFGACRRARSTAPATWRAGWPTATLEFLGRADHQVKVRGFRIELGEIEAALAAHPACARRWWWRASTAATAGWWPTSCRARDGRGPRQRAAARSSRERLPDYMVPAAFVDPGRLPLTPNGKVDRRALPDARVGWRAPAARSTAPRTPVEEIAGRHLVPRCSASSASAPHDDFFASAATRCWPPASLAGSARRSASSSRSATLFESADGGRPRRGGRAAACGGAGGAGAGGAAAPILEHVARDRALPLSFAQERLWFLDRLEPGSPPTTCRPRSRFDGRPRRRRRSPRALAEIVAPPRGRCAPPSPSARGPARAGDRAAPSPERWPLPLVDLGGLAGATSGTPRLRAARRRARHGGRSTSRAARCCAPPLLRLERAASTCSSLDHAPHRLRRLVDGRARCASWRRSTAPSRPGRPSPLPRAADPVRRLRRLAARVAAGEVAGARSSPTGASSSPALPPVLELPTDRPRPAVAELPRRQPAWSPLPADARRGARGARAARGGATLFMVLLAAFQALLAATRGQEDLVVGTPIAGRTPAGDRGADRLLRQHPGAARRPRRAIPRFRELLAPRARGRARRLRAPGPAVRAAGRGAAARARPRPHAALPGDVRPAERAARAPSTLPGPRAGAGRRSTAAPRSSTSSLCHGRDARAGSAAASSTTPTCSTRATVARLLGHFAGAARRRRGRPRAAPLRAAAASAEAERQQLAASSGTTTAAERPRRLTLHELVEAQAARTPGGRSRSSARASSLTYARARPPGRTGWRGTCARWASGPEVLVGVCLERSLEMLVGPARRAQGRRRLRAARPRLPARAPGLHAGGRRAPRAADAASALAERLPRARRPVVALDRDGRGIAARARRSRPAAATSPDNLAYVIYTSGSTGRPKGVQIPHRAVVNFLRSMARQPGPRRPDDALLAVTTLSFDIAGLELFLPLVVGARVVVAAARRRATAGACSRRCSSSRAPR